SHPYYVPELMDQRSPINWVRKIAVPTFLASAFQDEQTGGDFASMLSRLPKRRDVKITVTNGVHTSSLDPTTLWNWLAFLDLYVAERVPDQSRLAPIAPLIYLQILGASAPTPPLPPDRFADVTDYQEAKRRFEADPHVRVLMENGAGSPTAGLPAPTFPRPTCRTAGCARATGSSTGRRRRCSRRGRRTSSGMPAPSRRVPSPRSGLGCSRWRTRSERARASVSVSRRPVATARAG